MNRHEALRKAAILITALDAPTADALLDHMPETQSALVRQAVFDLDWIDPQEQEQVLADFLAASDRGEVREPAVATPREANAESNDVELVLSDHRPEHGETSNPLPTRRVVASVESYPPRQPITPTREPRFDFLREQRGDTLARLLEREHPQTIAVVAAHLPPERSAELLREMPAELNIEVLRRIADLDEIDPEMIDEMEQELRRSFLVSAIISAEEPGVASDPDTEGTGPDRAEWNTEPPADERSSDLASEIEAYRNLARSIPTDTEVERHKSASADEEVEPQRLVDWSFADVTVLSDMDLANVLQEAGSELTMVALAGSDAAFVARLSSQLSPVMARQFMSRMEEIGPLPLRDIEAAQERLAEIAAQLAEEGIITQKDIQPFAAAA